MSEESYAVAPWVGPNSSNKVFSVAVLSSNVEIIERISSALNEEHTKGNFRWKLVLLCSFNLEEVMKQSVITGRIAIDFVVLGMDTSKIMCLEWAKKAMCQVHPHLRSRRVVLVNASGLSHNYMAIYKEDLLELQSELDVELMHANVYKSAECKYLARTLLHYIEVSFGVSTGLPNLNI